MKRVRGEKQLRRAMSMSTAGERNEFKKVQPSRSRAERSASLMVHPRNSEKPSHSVRPEQMSSFGKNRGMAASSSNLYRSQSMASLGGDKMVLGEGFRSSYALGTQRAVLLKELGLNSKSISKIPKTPRPKRAIDIFNAVVNGLRDHVEMTEMDYNQAVEESQLKGSSSHNQRLKAIERHKKKLEYLLSKVEELFDHYQVQNQMREGTKALSKAYESSSGQHKKDSILNVHCGFKECTKTMCAIEAQLESMLGQFHCEMKGIMGFARVMPGDSFEVSIRHGSQKWKSKGYVSKDSEQTWDQDKRALNIQICSSLNVKVFESKRLSKSSLGEKHCDILGLFAANPQILTVNVNDIGTIKLNVLVQWMPLANFTEQMKYYDPPPRDAVSPRAMSVVVPVGVESPKLSTLPRLAYKTSQQVVSPVNHRPDLLCDMLDEPSKGSNMRMLAEAIDEEDEGDVYEWPTNLESAIHRLRQALAEYKQRSGTLQTLFSLISDLETNIEGVNKRHSLHRSDCEPAIVIHDEPGELQRSESSISLAIETAFDFLNDEEFDDSDSECEEKPQPLSPTSTSRSLADSGIESLLLTRQHSDVQPLFTTGNSDLDLAIIQHCALVEVLLENLDNVGMLKSKERSAMEVLKQQKNIFMKISQIVTKMTHTMDSRLEIKNILYQIIPHDSDVHEFWLSNTKPNSLVMTVADFSKALYRAFNSDIDDQYSIKPDRVFNAILKRISNGGRFSQANQPNILVSVFQFMYAILDSKCESMHFYVHEVASELWLLKQLKSGNSSLMIRSVQSLKGATPSFDIIKTLLVLLNSPTADISKVVGDYWYEMAHDRALKDAILPSVLSCLEESRPDVRVGACSCLERLRATNTAQELLYVAQADSSRTVQTAAKKALATLNAAIKTSSLD